MYNVSPTFERRAQFSTFFVVITCNFSSAIKITDGINTKNIMNTNVDFIFIHQQEIVLLLCYIRPQTEQKEVNVQTISHLLFFLFPSREREREKDDDVDPNQFI